MNDTDIRALLHEAADDIAPPDYVDGVRARVPAARRRRTVGGVAIAVAAVVVAATGVVVTVGINDSAQRSGQPVSTGRPTPTSTSTQTPPVTDSAAWTLVSEAPLSHRDNALVADVDGSIVVAGGYVPYRCPPRASCPAPPGARGGAVYDLSTDTWRAIADPPRGLWAGIDYGVDGDRLIVMANEGLWVYDLSADTWTQPPSPPLPMRGDESMTVGGDTLYLLPGEKPHAETRYEVLDLSTGTWGWLPRSTNEPILQLRKLLVTSYGIVVVGETGDVNGWHLHTQAEILEHGRWTRLSDPGLHSTGWPWSWTGTRLVAPMLENRLRGATLDLATRQWGDLPTRPSAPDGWMIQAAAEGDLVVVDKYGAGGDLLYDDATQTWTSLADPTEVSGRAPGSGTFLDGILYVVDRQGRLWKLAAAS